MRYCCAVVLLCAAAGPVAAADAENKGRELFLACDFKPATRVFERAVAAEPENAVFHFWLGKSYARLAEVSGPIAAPRNARKARRSLERAVQLEPRNQEYLLELFDFYVESPEWFSGGLERAASLMERLGPADSDDVQGRVSRLAESRSEHRGAGWLMLRTVLRSSDAVGHFVPQP